MGFGFPIKIKIKINIEAQTNYINMADPSPDDQLRPPGLEALVATGLKRHLSYNLHTGRTHLTCFLKRGIGADILFVDPIVFVY